MAKRPTRNPAAGNYEYPAETRRHIPTENTEPLMTDEQRQPKAWTSTPHEDGREPGPTGSTGIPRLNWMRTGPALNARIETLAAPLFEHERHDPAAWLERLRRDPTNGADGQRRLFGDDVERLFEFYEWEKPWMNRLVHGANGPVMASLLATEHMAGHVQLLFMDPPYGIDYGKGLPVQPGKKQPEKSIHRADEVKCFTDTYVRGVHSFLDGLYETFSFGRDLLAETGTIAVQIGRQNEHYVTCILEEVFGRDNQISRVTFSKGTHTSRTLLAEDGDYILWYAKNIEEFTKKKFRKLYRAMDREETLRAFSWHVFVEDSDGTRRAPTKTEETNPDKIPSNSRIGRYMPLTSEGYSRERTGEYLYTAGDGTQHAIACPADRHWSVDPLPGADQHSSAKTGLARLEEQNRLQMRISTKKGRQLKTLRWIQYEEEFGGTELNNLWNDTTSSTFDGFVVGTAEAVVERVMLMGTDPGDLVLDPTAGGGTIAIPRGRRAVGATLDRHRRWTRLDQRDARAADAPELPVAPPAGRARGLVRRSGRAATARTEARRTARAIRAQPGRGLRLRAGAESLRVHSCVRPEGRTDAPGEPANA